ncbi:AraC family transcriptional regulator [Ktedonobacter racemifer]|uniref:Transcriptional regulator, AraC family n=1 Tax=Ktedonobacter racemifer DSM 44963 TaxID=485913 RepID=D6U1M5_KTERA|nr:AraC family transcriptional regulator [Ktedonobacter racemifer]EFH82669.1 transcriptional regulator, AraC family [Ktedonobacter racemifer DSM 44963]
MAEKFAVSRRTSLPAYSDEPTPPILFLSSEEMGWDGLVARAYHEPMQFEGLIESDPDLPHIPLVLFAGGAMYMERRSVNGPWKGGIIRAEDLMLAPDGSVSSELRWNGLTSEPTQTLHLHLSKDLFARTVEEVADCDPARLTLIGRSGFQDPLLTQIGLALWRELEQPTPAGKLYAQTAAQMLAVHLLQHYTCAPIHIKEISQGLTRQQVQRVTDFIQAHLSQDLTLEALAQQAGFSSYHFARLFRQTMGESPHQFVLRQRVERAQHLLKKTNEPLAHIALESGFANQSHLTRTFKRYLGLTPRGYRQQE